MQRLEWLREQVELRGSTTHWQGGSPAVLITTTTDSSSLSADTAQNLDFALKTLSSALEVSDLIRPLQFSLPPGPRGIGIGEVVKMEVSVEETRQVLELAFSRLLLSHYRNQLLHLFLAEAMLALSVCHCLSCPQSMARHLTSSSLSLSLSLSLSQLLH